MARFSANAIRVMAEPWVRTRVSKVVRTIGLSERESRMEEINGQHKQQHSTGNLEVDGHPKELKDRVADQQEADPDGRRRRVASSTGRRRAAWSSGMPVSR